MRSYSILLLCGAWLALAGSGGCRLPRQQLAALEGENRQLDGKLWEMQFQIEALKDENQSLREKLAKQGERSPTDAGAAPRTAPKKADQKTAPDLPFEPDQFRPPVIELPPDAAPEGRVPESLLPGGPDKKLLPGPNGPAAERKTAGPSATPAGFQQELAVPELTSVPLAEVSRETAPIERIALSPHVGGVDMDGRPGDDGIGLVLEPWDKNGRMLAVAAPVSVVLIDPTAPPDAARVARWDLTADETAQLFLDGDIPGMHLALAFADKPPRSERLHLFVRYTTEDGRRLEADREISVDLGRRAAWVATATPRVYPYRPGRATELVAASTLGEPRRLAAPREDHAGSAAAPARRSGWPRRRRSRQPGLPGRRPPSNPCPGGSPNRRPGGAPSGRPGGRCSRWLRNR